MLVAQPVIEFEELNCPFFATGAFAGAGALAGGCVGDYTIATGPGGNFLLNELSQLSCFSSSH